MNQLTVAISEPLVRGTAIKANIDFPSRYSHTIEAVGGFWSAEVSFVASEDDLEEWIEEGIGRHVVVYDDALSICWEGFVNEMAADQPPLSVTRGPLLDMGNRVDVFYSGVDTSVIPPTTGMQVNVGVADDADSQVLYGIFTKYLTAGQTSATLATRARNMYLAENRLPGMSKDWRSGGNGPISISLRCLGYCHLLDYPYNQTLNVGTVTTAAKILEILAANPNIAWLPFDTTHVAVPAAPISVPRYEYENTLAWNLIQDCTAIGDTNSARWLFGIYANLEAWYYQAPITLDYLQLLHDPAQEVTTTKGLALPYSTIRPGKWIFFTDFLPGRAAVTNLYEDPRAMFIETVTFDAPNTLQLRGGKNNRLDQLLAFMGTSGTGI